MRLRVSRNTAQERLTNVLAQGYELRRGLGAEIGAIQQSNSWDEEVDLKRYTQATNLWVQTVREAVMAVFPTSLEWDVLSAQMGHVTISWNNLPHKIGVLYFQELPGLLDRLKRILDTDLGRYTDLPQKERLFIEDIDSFTRVRDVNPAMVAHLLKNGTLDISEDQVQLALEQILDVPFHKKDWGGELCDMYTANVIVNGARRGAAFLLKGPGIKKPEMTIADCGRNGDQLVRLFLLQAEIYIIQFVGVVSELLIADALGKVDQLRAQGREAHVLVMDGQDTARLLYAYGKLNDARVANRGALITSEFVLRR